MAAAMAAQKHGGEELPTSKSGAAAERSYPTSKVRSIGCALLEEL